MEWSRPGLDLSGSVLQELEKGLPNSPTEKLWIFQAVISGGECTPVLSELNPREFARKGTESSNSHYKLLIIKTLWRRERDSNPRYPFRHNGFQDRRFQPLTHPSTGTGAVLIVRREKIFPAGSGGEESTTTKKGRAERRCRYFVEIQLPVTGLSFAKRKPEAGC